MPITRSATATLLLASLVGLMGFLWPLLVDASSPLADKGGGSLFFAGVIGIVILVSVAEMASSGVDSKAVALLGVLAAIGAAVRPLGAGTAGVELVFFVLVIGGRVLGPGFGFVLGSVTLAASALLTAGVGPWLPYQMLAASWVGMGAGMLPDLRGRREVVMLAAYGAVTGLGYGLLLNLSFWPFALGDGTSVSFEAGAAVAENLRRLVAFTLATSMGWDIGRAVTTAFLVGITAPSLLRSLRRSARRANFTRPDAVEATVLAR